MKKNLYCSIALAILGCAAVSVSGCTGQKQSKQAETTEQEVAEAIANEEQPPLLRTCRDTITEIPYDIPAQRFDETAQALCHATGIGVKTDLSQTGSIKVNPVKGRMSILDAVKTAIKGTNLKITDVTDNTITVELASK